MIKVYEFKLSQDGKHLFFHVGANRATPTTDAVLSTLSFSTDGDFDGNSTKAFGLYLSELGIVENTGTKEAPIWTVTNDYQTDVAYNIDLEEVSTVGGCSYTNQLYYMEVTAHSASSTCTSVDKVDVIIFNKYPLYKAITCAMDGLVGCESPQLVTDYLLKLKALEAYIGMGINYKDDINRYYDWLIKKVPLMAVTTRMRLNDFPVNKPCGCGR